MMTTITITLPSERLVELEGKAYRLGITPEDFVRVSVEELLARPDEAFQQTMDYVLEKNKELYFRLA
jgi:hypothetical protein